MLVAACCVSSVRKKSGRERERERESYITTHRKSHAIPRIRAIYSRRVYVQHDVRILIQPGALDLPSRDAHQRGTGSSDEYLIHTHTPRKKKKLLHTRGGPALLCI